MYRHVYEVREVELCFVYYKTNFFFCRQRIHACGVLNVFQMWVGYWVWVGWSEEYYLTDLERQQSVWFITL